MDWSRRYLGLVNTYDCRGGYLIVEGIDYSVFSCLPVTRGVIPIYSRLV